MQTVEGKAAQNNSSVTHGNLKETISHAEQRTGRQTWASSGSLHFLASVWQHVVALGFVHQVPAGLWRFDQFLVVHHVQQVAGMNEWKPHHRQQLRHMLDAPQRETQQKERSEWEKRKKEIIWVLYRPLIAVQSLLRMTSCLNCFIIFNGWNKICLRIIKNL